MKKFISFAIAVVLVLAIVTPAMASSINEKKQELQDVKGDMLNAQDALDDVKTEEQDVSAQLEKLDKALEQKQVELDKAVNDLNKTEQELAQTEKDLAKAIEQEKHQKQLLDSRVRAMYMNNQVSLLEMILSAQSVSDLIMRVEMAAKITSSDNDLLVQMQELEQEIADKKKAIEQQKVHIEQQKQLIEEDKKDLENQRVQKSAYMAQLEQQKASYEKAIDEMEEQSKELEGVIRKLQAQEEAKRKAQSQSSGGSSSRSSSSPVATGQFVWPVPGYSRISSSFGYRVHPILGVGKLHTGVDIAAPQGVNVVAADNGTVIEAGWLGAYGIAVIIDHG